jgi:hypothetical protein
MLIVSLLINLLIIIIEIYVLSKLKNKKDLFKYYTYVQNVLCLIVSILFSVCVFSNMFFEFIIPEYVRGLRYMVTVGLIFTMLIYVLFLRKNNVIEDKEFNGISGKKVNILLHYICPLLSLISFIGFERSIIVNNGIWTMLVAIPSCLYWVIYLILSVTKLWEEPYDFGDSKLSNVLMFILIPISFIFISFILWNVR